MQRLVDAKGNRCNDFRIIAHNYNRILKADFRHFESDCEHKLDKANEREDALEYYEGDGNFLNFIVLNIEIIIIGDANYQRNNLQTV